MFWSTIAADNRTGANAWTIVSSGTLEDADFGYLVYTASECHSDLIGFGGYNTADPNQHLTFFEYRESRRLDGIC